MFPLTLVQYVKLGICVAVLAFSWYLGFSFSNNRFLEYKANQATQTQKLEKDYQAKAAQIESEKNAQIRNINSQLVDAISELRKRPSRATETSVGQSGTGASLFAEDAIFLRREAARADEVRAGLDACYRQYDALK
jgi:Tfp pilus assembly protein PilO